MALGIQGWIGSRLLETFWLGLRGGFAGGGSDGRGGRAGYVPQQHAAIAGVGVVAVEAELFCDLCFRMHGRRVLVAGEAESFLGHEQAEGRHVTAGLCEVAGCARDRHGGVDEFSAGLGGVARGTVVVFVESAGVFDGEGSDGQQEE